MRNPFKMAGSWIGLVAGVMFALSNIPADFTTKVINIILPSSAGIGRAILSGLVLWIVVGFLLGWLIQSLIQKIVRIF